MMKKNQYDTHIGLNHMPATFARHISIKKQS